jgi:hypothetical protein
MERLRCCSVVGGKGQTRCSLCRSRSFLSVLFSSSKSNSWSASNTRLPQCFFCCREFYLAWREENKVLGRKISTLSQQQHNNLNLLVRSPRAPNIQRTMSRKEPHRQKTTINNYLHWLLCWEQLTANGTVALGNKQCYEQCRLLQV